MTHGALTHIAPGSATDRAAELRRQARVIEVLFNRLAAVIQQLPTEDDIEGWRGPAANLFVSAVTEQRERLGRAVVSLDFVRTHLGVSAADAEAQSMAHGGMP